MHLSSPLLLLWAQHCGAAGRGGSLSAAIRSGPSGAGKLFSRARRLSILQM
jgi:hypothetical protein